MGGAIAGGLVAGRSAPRLALLGFAAAGAVADLDLLAGVHSGPTHSVFAALTAGLIGWMAWGRPARAPAPFRLGVAVAAAYATHPLLDWLSTDTTAPMGIMALWPLSSDHYLSPFRIFLPVSRRYWLIDAWWLNLRAVIREVLILGPLLWVVWWIRAGARMRSPS